MVESAGTSQKLIWMFFMLVSLEMVKEKDVVAGVEVVAGLQCSQRCTLNE